MDFQTYNSQGEMSLKRSEVLSRFMSKVYLWMCSGILVTAMISVWTANSPEVMETLFTNRPLFYGLLIGQVALVMGISFLINRMSAVMALSLFFVYAALTGVTLSSIFLIYTASSIQSAFFTTAFAFGGLSFFGYVTKKDLGPIGQFCGIGLFGLIGFGLLSLFFPSMMGPTSSRVYSLAGILIFAGLTAYDTQKIKSMALSSGEREGSEGFQKMALMGALTLYLDFINLFLHLLRLMGSRRD